MTNRRRIFLSVAVLAVWTNNVASLSQAATRQSVAQPVPVKRVCIVGAGIAGLSLAHALTNAPSLQRDAADELEVSIFDSREALDYTAGSGVQLNGGMACLGKINPDVQRAVIEAAIPISYLRGRHKSWSRENDVEKLWDYSVDEIIRSDETARKVLVDDNDKVLWYAIMRGALQETLVERLPKSRNVELVFGKTVTGINDLSGDALGGAYCQFADGSSAGPFDLIVGCDGIKSAVKEYVELGKISKDASKREGSAAALYSGIRINYAVQEQGGVEKNDPQPLQQCFADGAYAFSGIFGNGKDRPPCRCFFVTSLDDGFNGPFKRKLENGRDATQQIKSNTMDAASENADWTQNTRKPKDETREKMLEQIQRYGVVDESATSIISNADRFFELGVYFHNPLSLSGWNKKISAPKESYAVLCGDAAHAMPPFLGQGANQAIQDAYSLAQRIHDYNAKVEMFNMRKENAAVDSEEVSENPPRLKRVLDEYQSARFFPTASITVKAAILGYLETGGRDGFYAKFRDSFFKILDFAGVPAKVLLDSSTPKV